MKNSESFKQWPFAIPFTFSTVVMGLCVYKLIAGVPDNERALYWGGLTSVLAYWLPSPARIQESETFSTTKLEPRVQDTTTGLQIVQHPASLTSIKGENGNGNGNSNGTGSNNTPLRYQNGERHWW